MEPTSSVPGLALGLALRRQCGKRTKVSTKHRFSLICVYSEVTAERLDAEVERLITQAHQQARSVLTEHRDALDRLAQALLQEEVLERDQVLALVNGAQNTQGGASGEKASQRTPIQGASNH